MEDSIKLGPWGSQHQRGTHWSFKPKGLLTEIIISHGHFIESISFKSDDRNETINIEYSKKFAGVGIKTDKVSLDSPREYLTSVSGTHDIHNDVIQSLCFYTNRAKYGPFGTKLDKYNMYNYHDFNLSMEGGVIVGFHGCSGGILLYNIGVYVKHAADVFLSSPRPGQIATNKVTDVVLNVEMSREAGPWGGNKGKSWDDGVSSAVEQVNIKLDCSNEYLVGMVGFYGPIEENGGFEAVRSISFYTNKEKYGPFGTEIGTGFGSPTFNGKIVGFHGRSGAYLDAIGVHMEYF
ncbi:hypothetical protein LWI29_010943 [Acer saccharum]|uniref:Jacalin-type lectin domain-containing protein n=1 Tax=Acer saccharum TaxID=4024 RepID=A0AA39VZ19_ACESA|nr:hypothetical protein LWI29_010943 [Acer saccharum]